VTEGPLRPRALAAVLLVALCAALVFPTWRSHVAAGTAAMLFAVVAAGVARWTASLTPVQPTAYAALLRTRSRRRERPKDLEDLERSFGFGAYSRRDFDHRLGPVLRRLIAFKLQSGHGIALDAEPQRALAVLPPNLAGIVHASEPQPDDSTVLDSSYIEALLDAIEAL
jgi:hypothetical protein